MQKHAKPVVGWFWYVLYTPEYPHGGFSTPMFLLILEANQGGLLYTSLHYLVNWHWSLGGWIRIAWLLNFVSPGEFREKRALTFKIPWESQPGHGMGFEEMKSIQGVLQYNRIFINKQKWQLHETWKIQPSQKLSWAARMGNSSGVETMKQTVKNK